MSKDRLWRLIRTYAAARITEAFSGGGDPADIPWKVQAVIDARRALKAEIASIELELASWQSEHPRS